MDDNKDTLPRLHQVLPHMRDQLIALRDGASFEEARRRYRSTVEDLALQGIGRQTASRVGDQDAYWAPTADALIETMRLGFVERAPIPSARRYIESHRDRTYVLTPLGHEVADLAQRDVAAFCDKLAAAMFAAHPYFRMLIASLQEAPIGCPEVTESDVEQAGSAGKGTDYWVEYVSSVLDQLGPSGGKFDEAEIKHTIVSVVQRRCGTGGESRPTGKALTQAMNDAFAVAATRARGLPIGATDIDILKSWGSQLRVLDQSRYVPGFDGCNMIWLAADVEDGNPVSIQRRDLRRFERRVAEAVVDSYRSQAAASDTTLSAPYVPIYKVRAEVAYKCGVTRALVDLVIERLSDGAIEGIPVQVRLHLGTTRQPASEPLYRRGGNRRYELTIHPQTK